MPTATLSLPDGSTVTVQYPEGTSEQELIDYVKKQYNQKKLPSKPEPKDETSGSLGRTASALGAEVAIAEGAKYAGAAAGGALGSAVPVVGTAIGAGTGYVIGAISGGITGSLAAQEIENPDGDVSWGRVVSDTLLNFIPGSKIAKGGKFATRVGKAALANAAIGAGAAPAAQLIEGSIEGRLPTQEELLKSGITGALLGGALGASGEALSKAYGKFAGKNVDVLTDAYNKGDKDAKNVVDPLLEASNISTGRGTKPISKSDTFKNFQELFDYGEQIGGLGLQRPPRVDVDLSRLSNKDLSAEKLQSEKLLDKLEPEVLDNFESSTRKNVDDLAAAQDKLSEIENEEFRRRLSENIDEYKASSSDRERSESMDFIKSEIFDNIGEGIEDDFQLAFFMDQISKEGLFNDFIAANRRELQAKISRDPSYQADYKEIFEGNLLDRLNRGKDLLEKASLDIPKTQAALKSQEVLEAPKKLISQVATGALAKGDIVENFPKSAKGLVGLAKRTVSRVAPSAAIGRELDLDLERIRKEADGLEATADKIRSTIESKLKRDPSAKDKIDKFLTGESDLDSSLNDIAADLRKFKDEMAPIQEEIAQLIDADFYKALGPEERERLSSKIRESIAEKPYLKREYRIFTDENFVRSPAQRRKAQEEIANSIIRENPEVSKEIAMEQAGVHLQELEAVSARSQKGKERGYVPQSFQGSLKQKQNVGPEERKYLGEIDDPSEKVFGTLSGTARLRQAAKEDQAILDYVQRSGIGVQVRPGDMVPEDLAKLNLKTITDSNIYVPVEFEIALEKVRPRVAKQRDNFNKTWDSISGFVKAKNVLGNAPAYATQLVSGIGLTLSNGIMPRGRYFKNVGRGTQVVAGDFKALSKIPGIQRVLGDRKAFLDDYQDAVSLGIINQNVEASDIRNAFEGSFKPLKKIIDPLGKVYSAPDSTYRYALWKSNQDSISKMFPGLDEQSAKRLAANFTNDTFPNYERVSGAAKFLSRKAAINPYISFTLETFRNVYNQVKYADQMLKGEFGRNLGIDPSKLTKADQAAMRLEGLKRLGAVIGVVGGSTAAATGAVNVFKGKDETTLETDEEKQAYQETIANSWDRGKTLVATMNEDRSKSRYADPSYLVPQAIIRDAIKAGLSGDPDAITKYVVDQFGTDGGLVVRPLLNAIANKDDFGNILESQEDYGAEERAMYLFKELLTPPTLREAKKWEEALEGKGKYDVGDLTKRAFGLRVNAVDNKQQARFNIMDSVKNLQETKRRFYRDAEELQDADLQAAYQRSNAQAKQSYDKIARHYKNLQTLGFSENEIFTIMKKEAGVSSKDLLRISSGLGYENFEATKAKNIRELYEDLDPEISKDRAIRAIEDPEIRRRLENYQKEQEFIEKKNISIRERTLMGLTNVEKVQYLKNNNASRGEIIDLWKRKVISGKVRAEALRNSRR